MRGNPGDLILCGDGKYRMRSEIAAYLAQTLPPDLEDDPDEVFGPPSL